LPLDYDDVKREVEELSPTLGENAYLLYSMGLRLRTLDYDQLRDDSLLDGPDDKKIDFFRLDYDTGIATIVQGYFSQRWDNREPPSNKASDLNTAMAWLLQSDLKEIPKDSIRAAAQQLRDGLQQKEISRLEIYFVHNLRPSSNVEAELGTVQRTTQRLLENYPGRGETQAECVAQQVSRDTVAEWRQNTHETISVHDEVQLTSLFTPQELHSAEWHAVVASVPARQLVALRTKYGETLSSANVRDYLGSRQTARNINRQIARTVVDEPRNFWVYNNGITLLTNGITVDGYEITLNGIAIINGAQTTGSIAEAAARGSVGDASVMVRAIRCNDPSLVDSVIRFNNTQNPIKAWELRVIDPIQRNIETGFEQLGITYQLRRGGGGRRKAADVSYEQLGPYLSAFYGDPIAAHKNKAELFENESRYRRLFDDASDVRNLLFIFRLGAGVARAKAELKAKIDGGIATPEEISKYQYFRYGSFGFTLIYVCAEIIGLLMRAPDATYRRRVTLRDAVLRDPDRAEAFTQQLVEQVLGPVHAYLKGKDAYQLLKTQDGVAAAANHARTIFEQVQQMNAKLYDPLIRDLRLT
jgi:hypothetical protein